ncbi:MAG: DUF6377 domain-containing protein [Bacteroidales bacterium]|nr:DUF6377 domain-containing protein [Bacteroides sp.]MCM1198875.1 DUF6377 domain-containing protein [Clostridium sp.]MCM1503480.1 DUF6377 domain-containing protein [Bacteroidales bacterium]
MFRNHRTSKEEKKKVSAMLYAAIAFTFATACFTSCGDKATGSTHGELEKALAELDRAVEEFTEIDQSNTMELLALGNALRLADNDTSRLLLCDSLARRYSNICTDSMVIFSELMLKYAQGLGDRDMQVKAAINLCSVSQIKEDFLSALRRFESIDTSGISRDVMLKYYNKGTSIYYSLFVRAFNTEGDIYLNRSADYNLLRITELRESYLRIDSTSFNARLIKVSNLRDNGDYVQALDLLDKSAPFASTIPQKAQFHRYRSVLYNFLGMQDRRAIELALASKYDLLGNSSDNLSLIGLARHLTRSGDLDRAVAYSALASKNSFRLKHAARMSYSENTSRKIMKLVLEKQKRTRHILIYVISALSILLTVLLVIITDNYKLKKKRTRLLAQLQEANAIKNTYLFKYMTIASEYLDKADERHKGMRKLIRYNKIDELSGILRAPSPFEEERKAFYRDFDNHFAKVFPHFLPNLNEIMQEEHRYSLYEDGTMPTELRMLAVMRLGMTDSRQISRFMKCSLSTIYTYRSRAAEKSIYQRSEFEEKVSKLPL